MKTYSAQIQAEKFISFYEKSGYKCSTDTLAGDCGDGHTSDSETKEYYQQNIQKYVQYTGNDQYIQRTSGIAGGSQDRSPHIIGYIKNNTEKVYMQVYG